jgi:monomeric sarcosine oxidase
MDKDKTFDVAVVGAGVFGAWTALQLRRAGAEVVLVDAYGPGNNRASSGGESRMIRMGYGPDQIYTRMAIRSLALWQELFGQVERGALFRPTGILWLARDNDAYCEATLKTLDECSVQFERLDRDELQRRYPQIGLGRAESVTGTNNGEITWAILEPASGVLMASQAVRAVVDQAQALGVTYRQEAVLSPKEASEERATGNELDSIRTSTDQEIFARQFVFACGPWLPKIFPKLLGELIHVTRQDVFFFGVPGGDNRFGSEQLPAWIEFGDLVYALPNLDNRGVKVAIDAHGAQFDPDTGDRIVTEESLASVRKYLAGRIPALANAPVTETRVCQYENTSNGDFLIDRHPGFENVWLVGGGSGHGFKHGPAVGEHVASLIAGNASVEPRFSLATKERVHLRTVF